MDSQQDDIATKQVIVVRKDLKMPKGKIAAQTAHAAHLALASSPGTRLRSTPEGHELTIALDAHAYAWLAGEYRKVCVTVDSEQELLELHLKAQQAGLRCALVRDNGHTIFNGVKTYTALAIGPAAEQALNPLTGGLPLL